MSLDRYEERMLLSEGTMSNVYVAFDKEESSDVVIKMSINDNERSEGCIQREIESLSILKHKNIITMKEYSDFYIVFPKFEGDLFDYVTTKEVTLSYGLYIFTEVCFALRHCHRKKIAHLDIKPENIFLSPPNKVVLGDFGGSAKWCSSNPFVSSWIGTTSYCAPETQEKSCFKGDKADIWSMGVLLHVILTGYYPYESFSDIQLSQRIPQLIREDLIEPMLSINPDERPDIHEVIHTLKEIAEIVTVIEGL